jgi:hypothetical protein
LNKPCIRFFLLSVILLCAAAAGALDFGLVASQEAKISNETSGPSNGTLVYSPLLSPWVSGPLGKSFNLYLSGKIGFEYTTDFDEQAAWRDPAALPELDRSELIWQASPSLSARLGRQRFRDTTGLIAAGLFDGVSAGFSAGGGRFSAGAWYTGLLYKDTADIVITPRDHEEYQKPFALDEGYFASRRALVSFDWEKPDLGLLSSLALGVLGQFDLNDLDDDDEDRLHSQYLSARYGLRLPAGPEIQASAVFGIRESPEWAVFFAGGLGLNWALPGALDDGLSLGGLYSSPSHDDRLSPFIPVNSLPRGQVFSPILVGLSILRGAYTLRPLRTLSLTGEVSYFIRTDTVSFRDNRELEKLKGEGYYLGGECYGTALWAPLPDVTFTFGGGAFFPGLGDAFTEEAEIRWKAAAGIILSL